MNKKFTLIIPTYNRYNKLLRLLKYYSSFDYPFPIKILDSSKDKTKSIQLISILKNENIDYIEFDSEIQVIEKINVGLSEIQTPFSALCADDDFLVPNAIDQSVRFLEENSDYSICQGLYTSFEYNSKNTKWSKAYNLRSVEQNLPSERIYDFLSNYSMTVFYGVHRTEFLSSICEASFRETSDVRFGELLPAMLCVIYGKMKVLNVLYSAREILATSSRHTYKKIYEFIKEKSFDGKFHAFQECLINALLSKEDISKIKAQKLLYIAMNNYMGRPIFRMKLKASVERITEKHPFLNNFYIFYKKLRQHKTQNHEIDRVQTFEFSIPENPFYGDFININEAISRKI